MIWDGHKTVFFSGGGLKVAPFLGCLEAVDLRGFEAFYGLSAGSLIACLLAAGKGVAFIQEKLLDLVRSNFFFEACSFERLLEGRPILDPEKLRGVLDAWLLECGVPRGATLAWMAAHRRAAFGCFAAELETGRVVLFEATTWPGVRLVDALMASMALPGAVEAVRLNGRSYADLGIANNTPLSFLKAKPGKLLAFTTNRQLPLTTEKLSSPMAALWLKTSFLINAELSAVDPRCVTVVEMPPPPSEVHFFRASPDKIHALFRQGRTVLVSRLLRSELAGLLLLFCHGLLGAEERPTRRPVAETGAARVFAWGRGAAQSLLDLLRPVAGKAAS